ncbi:MAG: CRTAC1 family protein, partial [Acidobacteriota bacterium]
DMPLYWEIFRQSGFSFVDVFQDMASGNTLLRNKGDGTFDDVTWETEANPPGWFWGSGFADFDNDGWQDIYAANGWVYNAPDTEIELEFLNNVVSKQDEYKTGAFFDPDNFGGDSWHGYERNRHLINLGDGNFKEVGRAVGTDLLLNSRGIAVADFWNRGVLDIAVAASTDRHALLRNEVGSARDYLAVELVGAAGELDNGSNRDAVGARVIVEAGGQTMTREIALGDGYSSQNSLRLYFGLGSERSADPEAPAPVVDKVTVRWPRSGIVQTFESVAGNRIVEIQENRDDMVEKTYAPPTIEAADDAVAGGEGTEVADVGTGGSGSGATAPGVAGEAP